MASRIVVICVFGLVACGGGTDDSSDPPPVTLGEDTSSAFDPDPPRSDLPAVHDSVSSDEWTVGIIDVPARGEPATGVVVAIRTASHPEYDRFTIEFDATASLPGYHIEYIDRPLRDCGSGHEIHPVGDGWLEIRMQGAAAHTEAGQPTLPGREMAADASTMLHVYRTCDFEAVVTFVVAVSSPNPYRVLELDGPARLAVDVRASPDVQR